MQKCLMRVGSFVAFASLGPIVACAANDDSSSEATESSEQAQSRKQKGAASGSPSGSGTAPPQTPAADARCGKVDFGSLYFYKFEHGDKAPPVEKDDIIGEKQQAAIQKECTRKLLLDPKFDLNKTPVDPRSRAAACGTCPKGKTGCAITNPRVQWALSMTTDENGETTYKCSSAVEHKGNPNDGYQDIYSIYFEYDCSACTGPNCAPSGSASGGGSSSSSSGETPPASSSAPPPASSSASPAPSGSGSS